MNRAKTKIICFKQGRQSKRERWHIDGEQIEVEDTFEYLGIVLSTSISWSHAIKNRIDKATKAIYNTLSHTKKFGRLRAKTLLDTFDKQIVPILLYGCEIWGLADITAVEGVASKFYKRLLLVLQNSSVDFVRGELGRRSLKLTIFRRILNYWFKLLCANPYSYYLMPIKPYNMNLRKIIGKIGPLN